MLYYLLLYEKHVKLKERISEGCACIKEMAQGVVNTNNNMVALMDSRHNDPLKL